MWTIRLAYLLPTILLAYVDKSRIKSTFGEVQNIDKKFSWSLGVIVAILIYLYCHDWDCTVSWDWLFFFEAIAIRGIFYDPALNLFRRKKIDYRSKTTNSKTDKKEWVLFKSFWHEKIAYGIIEIIFIIISYLL